MAQIIVLSRCVGKILQFTFVNNINELSQEIGVRKEPDMILRRNEKAADTQKKDEGKEE